MNNIEDQINCLPVSVQKQIYGDVHEAKHLYSRIKMAITAADLTQLSGLLAEIIENPIVLSYLQTKIPTFIETQQQIILSHQTKTEFAELWYNILAKQ